MKTLMNMNLPNKLTMLRVILIPFFVAFLLDPMGLDAAKWIALILFIAASVTDALDGHIARKNNLVTNFGKFMDPLADKLLVSSALIGFVELEYIPTWIVMVIIAREFVISGFRLIAADNGIVIAAGIWGKLKTVCQMVMIIVLIADLGGIFDILGTVLIWLSLILTLISLADYLYNNRKVLSMQG